MNHQGFRLVGSVICSYAVVASIGFIRIRSARADCGDHDIARAPSGTMPWLCHTRHTYTLPVPIM